MDPRLDIRSPDAFSRLDESDDRLFYERDRFVQHLDATALATVEGLIASLVTTPSPAVLDLMASWDSHLPETLAPSRVAGLGLNRNELERNPALTELSVYDLNASPVLPYGDDAFDVVLNTVSIDYLTRPVEVFRDVGRVLKPGGLLLVVFSNRMFEPKAVRIWREASEDERVDLVKRFVAEADRFEAPEVFVSKGKPRPADDRYAHLGIPSDPVYAVYADSRGGPRGRTRRALLSLVDKEELERKKAAVASTLACPYCDAPLSKWAVPQTPFTEWDTDYLYVCFNDACPYFDRGWSAMTTQGNPGFSYRLMHNPHTGACHPLPVPTRHALKDSIVPA